MYELFGLDKGNLPLHASVRIRRVSVERDYILGHKLEVTINNTSINFTLTEQILAR